jgi:hypothetical protein
MTIGIMASELILNPAVIIGYRTGELRTAEQACNKFDTQMLANIGFADADY